MAFPSSSILSLSTDKIAICDRIVSSSVCRESIWCSCGRREGEREEREEGRRGGGEEERRGGGEEREGGVDVVNHV